MEAIRFNQAAFILDTSQPKIAAIPRVEAPNFYEDAAVFMDTIISLVLYGGRAKEASEAVFAVFKRIEKLCSRFDPTSEVSEVSQAAGYEPVPISKELFQLLTMGKDLSALFEGNFDITIGPVSSLWQVGYKTGRRPAAAQLQEARALVDYRKLHLASGAAFLSEKGMMLDLGGLAKEYALYEACRILPDFGVTAGLINAGGDICTSGVKPDQSQWRVGIEHPRRPGELIAEVTLDQWDTVETSGDYRRFFVEAGSCYSHIFDPTTGLQPGGLASVSLIYRQADQKLKLPSCAFLALGIEKSLVFLENFPGVEAFFITQEGKTVATDGLIPHMDF
ncbi:MAG: FAD:protein FMN transferase [Sporomusaceae bacterium]|nr:FAD:protein FMN transferase [Sporomusaceae bacterium]